MIRYDDSEVEVLGLSIFVNETKKASPPGTGRGNDDPDKQHRPSRRPGRRKKLILIIVIVLAVAIVVGAVMWVIGNKINKGHQADEYIAARTALSPEIIATSICDTVVVKHATGTVYSYNDSINDVVFTIYPVDSLRASVTFEYPSSPDAVVMATPGADFRADNGGIVGEFIHNRKWVSEGIRKEGWCYINPAGAITIGIGEAADEKAKALADGGTFFRQYALVMDGQITPNILKGKAKSRALGFIEGRAVIVKSHERESIYDFSQALADYGFSHAIYLPGGESRWICATPATREIIETPNTIYPRGANYLIFR